LASLNRSSVYDNPLVRQRVAELRSRGYRGTTIMRHRAFQTAPLNLGRIIASGILAGVFTVAWLLIRPAVGRLWAFILQTGVGQLGLPGGIRVLESQGAFFATATPQVDVPAMAPDTGILVGTGILIVTALVVSLKLPPWLTPLTYLLRAYCFIQTTAVVFFLLFPSYFKHTLSSYMSTMVDSSMFLLSAIPAIMAFTYYIFDIDLGRKLLLTAFIMLHLTLLVPLQYMAHIYIIAEWSLLFMPALYIMFGLLVQVAIFIAFYSWGMTWKAPEHSHSGAML
jgi:hypothetical protein